MTSSPHAPEPHRATARLDIWTVNVTEPVFVGCLSSREPVPAICRPAALLAHLCPCHLEPGMSETRSWVSGAGGTGGIRAGEVEQPQKQGIQRRSNWFSGQWQVVVVLGNYERYDGRCRSPAPALAWAAHWDGGQRGSFTARSTASKGCTRLAPQHPETKHQTCN